MGFRQAWADAMVYRSPEALEEPTECKSCGAWFEATAANRCSLDAYADAGDYDTFCPVCESDEIVFHRPKEDEMLGRLEDRKLNPRDYDDGD